MIRRIRKVGAKIYILCNGELAESLYFGDFKNYLTIPQQIVVRNKSFVGMSPWEFIKTAIQYKKDLIRQDKFSKQCKDQMWCIFDIDNYWKENERNFRLALEMAKKHDLHLAWSNQCFELWFLCHFDQSIATIPRTDYHKKLKKHFKDNQLSEYNKNMPYIFETLLPFQKIGIKNAKKLYVENTPERDPSTAMFLLVEELIKLSNF